MMLRTLVLALTFALAAAGCDDSPSSPSGSQSPRFTVNLTPGNEVPPITAPNVDAGASGTVTVTLNVTRDSANNITSATADFQVTMAGFPAGTTLTGAHIHDGPAGANRPIVVNTGIAEGEIVLATGSGQFTRTGISVDPALAQAIINGPSGFYFNVHTQANRPGAIRGQLG